ncbi:MAG: hypothetical protein MUP81_00170 [Dehalococcoidia bacterium]|nr:hypothetical protein [Dehalococcoidia bacterium]
MNEDLLLTPKKMFMAYLHDGVSEQDMDGFLKSDLSHSLKEVCQAQLDEVLKQQSQALQDFANNKITFERLAEEMMINFYVLHSAFICHSTREGVEIKCLIRWR